MGSVVTTGHLQVGALGAPILFLSSGRAQNRAVSQSAIEGCDLLSLSMAGLDPAIQPWSGGFDQAIEKDWRAVVLAAPWMAGSSPAMEKRRNGTSLGIQTEAVPKTAAS